jgi:hypothetical protein
MASNAANQIFTNAAPPTYTVDWSRIVLFIVLFVVICATAYLIYINFFAQNTTMYYPFHQDILNKWNEWYGPHVSSYTPESIQPEQDKKSEDDTSDQTKLIGTPNIINPPSSQPSATPSTVDTIAESIVHNGESDEDKRERKREREHRREEKHEKSDEKKWKRPQDEREHWCFVGEDLSGRYCVRVPSDKQCTSERLFHSRVDCEMAAANHLPAGVLTRNGDKYVPLATKNIV